MNAAQTPGIGITVVDQSAPNATDGSWRRDLLLLTLAGALLFGFGLGTSPLANPDEGRYAEIPREMVASGDWVTPRLNDVVYFEKPPLVYWMVAVCLKVFGPAEWSMRLVPVFFALAGTLLTYAAGRSFYGRTAGLIAAATLATSLLYFALSRILILDMAVSVLMSATLFCFLIGLRTPRGSGPFWRDRRRWLFYGLYASAALATLTKGLMGFLVTGGVMFFWLLIFNQWRRLLPIYLPSGALLFLAIAAPWHILAAQQNETWARFYFVHEHWERFTADDHGKYEPWWYFIPVLLVGLHPWTGLLIASVRDAVRGGFAAARREHADRWFLLFWAAFIFLFFSASRSKIATYILPIFPALAVLLGAWLSAVVAADARDRLRWGLRVFAFLSGLLGFAMLVVVVRPDTIPDLRKYPEQIALLKPYAGAAAFVLLTGGILAPWLARVKSAGAAIGALGLSAALFFGILGAATPHMLTTGTKELALKTRAIAAPGDRVMHYHMFFQDFLFYAERPVDIVAYQGELEFEQDPVALTSGRFLDEAAFRQLWTGPGRLLVIARKRDTATLFADPAFAHTIVAETRTHTLFSNRP